MSRVSGWGSTDRVNWGMDDFGRLIVYWGKRYMSEDAMSGVQLTAALS